MLATTQGTGCSHEVAQGGMSVRGPGGCWICRPHLTHCTGLSEGGGGESPSMGQGR